MKNPISRETALKITVWFCIIAIIAMIVIAIRIDRNTCETEEARRKNLLGDHSEQLMVSIGKMGEETFYYLVPEEKDSKVIYPLHPVDSKAFITAPPGQILVKIQSNRVIDKGKKIVLEH